MADPEALKRALGNLIDNAAEAMQSSLLRELHITTTLHERGVVELTVADTGTGLTDDMRERLFLPYFSPSSAAPDSASPSPPRSSRSIRAPSEPKRTSRPEPSSSSSSMPLQWATAMQKPRQPRSPPKQSAHQWLPSGAPQDAALCSVTRSRGKTSPKLPAKARNEHVLIVDDEAEIRDSLESILKEEDYIVTTAAPPPRR